MTDRLTLDHWHPIAHKSELEDPGDYVRLSFDGIEAVAYNDAGEIVVFDNRCPHRGARIFDQRYGNSKFTCKYHGWTRRSGQWLIPRQELFSECTEVIRLNEHQMKWCGDWLFFCPGTPCADLYSQLAGLEEVLREAGDRIGARADFHGARWRCDWRCAVENALEDYHVPMVHRETLGKLGITDEKITRLGKNIVSGYRVGDARMARLLAGPPLYELSHPPFRGAYVTYYIFPYAQLSTTAGLTYALQLWAPDGINRTAFSSRTYAVKRSPNIAHAYDPFAISACDVNRKVFDEDRQICERLEWRDNPILGKAEEKISMFREAIK